jgi:hypothetical protein
MKKILLWSFVALMVVAFGLTPEPARPKPRCKN